MSGRSRPIQINQTSQSDGDSDDDYGDNQRDDDIMTIGSLPGSRRSRRMMVSSGGNELYGSSLGVGHSQYFRNRMRGGDDGLTGEDYMARSLPVPRAPNLHSRRDHEMDISRIPDISLPGSVTENSEPSSIPYGSLNESKLHLPISRSPGGLRLHDTSDLNKTPTRFYEQLKGNHTNPLMGKSLPAYIPNNSFGHASLSKESDFGGIGSILGDKKETAMSSSESVLTSRNSDIGNSLSRQFEEKVGIGNALGYSNTSHHTTATALYSSSQEVDPFSTSLTAFSILEKTKLPAGTLSSNETDSIRAVARSLSYEDKDFGIAQSSNETSLHIDRTQVSGAHKDNVNSNNNGHEENLDSESDNESYMEAFVLDMDV